MPAGGGAARAGAAIFAYGLNLPPVADANGPYNGTAGIALTFDGSASTDPDGDALTYSWNFGDGGVGTGVMPVHSYAMAGNYTVTLIVNDGEFDSAESTAAVEITDPVVRSDGQVLYDANCLFCHGDPWSGPAVDDSLPGLRRVAGARSCNIHGSIFGTSVFPNGVPEMQFLQGLSEAEVDAMAETLAEMGKTGVKLGFPDGDGELELTSQASSDGLVGPTHQNRR